MFKKADNRLNDKRQMTLWKMVKHLKILKWNIGPDQ